MAEESDLEKTEPASPRRLEKAREEGNVARSRELVTCSAPGSPACGRCPGRDGAEEPQDPCSGLSALEHRK
jgi:hypothetical protein